MDIATVLLIAASLFNAILLIWILKVSRHFGSEADVSPIERSFELLKSDLIARQSQSIMTLRDSIDETNKVLNERFSESNSSIDRRLAVFGEIENRLGDLSRQTAQIETVGKNIQSLSELLRPPAARGAVGEVLLENLLSQILPRALYDTQYSFAGGSRVDAIVRIGDKLLPVDAKFPLDSYTRLIAQPDDKSAIKEFNRTMKKHIDAIADKYIHPEEQTLDFAVMYIPSEAVYYQLITQKELDVFDYALSRRVIPSSPGHFYGFLASVSAAASGVTMAQSRLEEDSRWLVGGLRELQETVVKLEQLHDRMSGSVRSLSSSIERSKAELRQITGSLSHLLEPVLEKEEESAENASPLEESR